MSRRLRVVVASLAALGLVALVSQGCADRLFYRPNGTVYGTPADHGLREVERVSFSAPNGPDLDGWWVPATATPSLGTVVYCHGNSDNLTLHTRYIAWLPARGFNVFVFDYRGYGRSGGSPSREGTVADARAALDFALARDPERTLVFGHSLGGAIALVAAAARPAVRAVVAEATFPSYRAIASARAGILAPLVPLFVAAGSDPIDALPELASRPLLVVHGTDDRIVPFALGQQLFAQATGPKQFHRAEGCGHATPWLHQGTHFEDVVTGFFARALASTPR